jgi:hypothetical protein
MCDGLEVINKRFSKKLAAQHALPVKIATPESISQQLQPPRIKSPPLRRRRITPKHSLKNFSL